MSLSSAMLAGVAGLQSNSAALAAISENIANVNTVGYKNANVDFEALVNGSGANSTYSAGGVSTTNQQFVTQQGAPSQTSSPTDLAISGQGMFVTSTAPAALNASNQVLFTRAGSFTPDSAGYLQNSAGLYLMGWAADANGDINTSTSVSSLSPINVDALSGEVSATTSASVSGNLDASQTPSAAVTAGTYSATTALDSMTGYDSTATTATGVKPDFTMQIPVSDSLGGQHTVQVDFLKSSTPNVWNVEIQAVPPGDVSSPTGAPAGQLAYGTATFDANGNLVSTSMNAAGSTGAPTVSTSGNITLPIGASDGSTTPATAVSWASNLGVGSQTLDISLAPSSNSSGLSQLASTSTQGPTDTNGTTFGTLSSVAVDKNGFVTATFSNGTSRQIAQVAMATFPNEDGLLAVNGDAYQATSASGGYNLEAAGSGGAGTIASSALESSTVDLSTEFTNLITTQSAYSAASKVITTADNMTQALLQIIQG